MTASAPKATPMVACYILGTGTDVGKTLFSATLLSRALQKGWCVRYFKPVQTGWPKDDDTRFVSDTLARIPLDKAQPQPGAESLFRYRPPVSPHRAIGETEAAASDDDILNGCRSWLRRGLSRLRELQQEPGQALAALQVIEGAGGALSPMPSGTLTADALRPLRLPVILIGEWRLGGISQSLATLDALTMRGFDVPLLVYFEGQHENGTFVSRHVSARPRRAHPIEGGWARTQVVTLPLQLDDLPRPLPPVEELLGTPLGGALDICLEVMARTATDRLTTWEHLKDTARHHLWWPFTQHGASPEPAVIDDAFGANLGIVPADREATEARLGIPHQTFDGSASWWTQGLGHGHPELAKAAAYAAGRYGHVLFPGQVHAPAASLASRLVAGVGKGWAQRVFFSDNGSTSVEVALKMAFRLAETRGVLRDRERPLVMGLSDSYHGDTLGACNATSPNLFKDRDRWYQPTGVWLSPPLLALSGGIWQCTRPHDQWDSQEPRSGNGAAGLPLPADASRFGQIEDIFDFDGRARSRRSTHDTYLQTITQQLDAVEGRIGAVLVEPLIHGAAGMLFVDPLFQRTLVDEAKRRHLPVIFDEVFSGFWRFGVETAITLLNITPDVACYSKTLTGGVVPLAVTLASQETYEAFLGKSKEEALLHGHSYTAHPIGCTAAVTALDHYEALRGRADLVKGYWSEEILVRLSRHKNVSGVVCLGTVIAITLRSETLGYGSPAGDALTRSLRAAGILARSLGSVVYLIAHPLTQAVDCIGHLRKLEQKLEENF